MKRYAVSIVNGYMILKNAYDKKEQLRFATIDYSGAAESPVRQSQSHSSDGTEPP